MDTEVDAGPVTPGILAALLLLHFTSLILPDLEASLAGQC